MDYTKILEAIITLLVAVITAFVIPYIKSKLSENELAEIIKWVQIAVQAAEMIYNESGMGKEKKKYVETFLTEHNIKVDIEQLDALIESAVLELKKELETKNE